MHRASKNRLVRGAGARALSRPLDPDWLDQLRRRLLKETLRVLPKLLQATLAAKVIGCTVVLERAGGRTRLDSHPADGINELQWAIVEGFTRRHDRDFNS